VRRLAVDTARAYQPVPVLYAVEALAAVGVRARATRALRDAEKSLNAGCATYDPIRRAALTMLAHRLTHRTRACLLPALNDPDTQTRWLVRRALTPGDARTAASLPEPVGSIRPDGLVAKSPAQLGTLTATYDAARALTASGRPGLVPDWLEKKLKVLGSDPSLDPSDRLPLAMICHRLTLDCGPQADKGAAMAARLKVPIRLTAENRRGWYGAMAARAEFGLGCPDTSLGSPAEEGALWLRGVVALADAGCAEQAERLTDDARLVARARAALREGDLVTASDAAQAALASGQSIPQTWWDELPALLERYRDARFPDLYAASPGGRASADATRAAYYLLA
jgi:hypothetical protein